MRDGFFAKHMGVVALVCGAIAATIYMLMIGVTLAHIQAVSGHVPFDMRPLGYRYADAVALLQALGEEGRGYYLSRQLPLDTFYPAMLALTLIATVSWFGQGLANSKLARFGIVSALGCALFDYAENIGVALLICNWPDVSAPLVFAASTVTIIKSVLTTVAILLTIMIGFLWARFRFNEK